MKITYVSRRLSLVAAGLCVFLTPASFLASSAPQSPNISVSGQFSNSAVRRGTTVRATIVMDIPAGYHVNSNRPLEKFLVATQLRIEAPGGIRVGPVSYPRAVLRSFKFSKSKVSVYEGRATMRFNVTVPPNFTAGSTALRARLLYQSCNDESCFPPQTKEVSLSLTVN
jgi:thiol:disulfide interchange protein DsbD